MLNIFIVDDQILLREGLKLIIDKQPDMTVVGTAENGQVALDRIGQTQPDIVLMDIRMPVMDGIECTKLVKERYPHIVVLILTTFNEEQYIIEGLAHKANGFLLKGMEYQSLIQSIRDASRGQFMLPSEVAAKLAARVHQMYDTTAPVVKWESIMQRLEQSGIRLNEREEEILQCISRRLSNREIASRLFISEGTAKNYITEVYRKLGVKNRQEALQHIQNLTT